MAGLLSDVLPFVYSQADRIKRHAKGLLSDPAGTMAQTAGLLGDKHREQQGLMAQAFADKTRPFRVTDEGAMMQAAQAMLNGPLGMAPAGITAWHGSPHIFDKFDSSKIGTGEGAQAYGHGLYLAEAPEVAKGYQQRLATNYIDGAGQQQAYGDVWNRAADAAQSAGAKHPDHARAIASQVQEWVEAGKQAKTFLRYNQPPAGLEGSYKAAVDAFAGIKQNPGALYKVDLPDSAVAKMLDWDKPLGQQAPEIQAAFAGKGYDVSGKHAGMSVEQAYNGLAATAAREAQRAGTWKFSDKTGARQGGVLAMDYGGASNKLRELGIPGIRYLDGGSRGAGQGSSNFVVFPGEENILKILERNGQPLR